MIITYVQYAICILTAVTGVYSLLSPKSTVGFTGLAPQGGRGISEIRSVLGGLFIALGVFPLVAGSPAAYAMLGWGYLGIALVRVVSIFLDKSSVRSNWISLVIEVVFGALLLI